MADPQVSHANPTVGVTGEADPNAPDPNLERFVWQAGDLEIVKKAKPPAGKSAALESLKLDLND